MNPVYQDPSITPGNCLQAAVASLFELPIGMVPHFYQGCTEATHFEGHERFRRWLAQLGLMPREVDVVDKGHGPQPAWDFPHLACGKSPRGLYHVVIRKGFEIIHDPHPDGGGVDLESVTELHVCDPALIVPRGVR